MTKVLRRCVARGEFGALADLYAPDAVLDASLPGARTLSTGPAEIVAFLESRFAGRGRIVEWTVDDHDEGAAIWLERLDGDGSATRQRHYLRLSGGAVARHWIYAAPPRSTAPRIDGQPAPAVFERLGVVEREPLVSTGWSGNALERLRLADGTHLIAKRVVPSAGPLGRLSRDPGREGLLFTEGLFDRMPATIDTALVAAEPDGDDAWWIVMRDVSDLLLDARSPISRDQNRLAMRAVNAMWEEFEGVDAPFLCDMEARLGAGSPEISKRERDGLDLLPKQFEAAWEAFADAVPPDVAEPVLEVLGAPGGLAREMVAREATLIHGDLRDEQIGFDGDSLILLDWGLATLGHPVVDLSWHMVHDAWRTHADHDEMVDDYRRARGERDDPYAVELGMIAGLVQYGWIFGHSAVVHPDPAEREWALGELDWWVPRVRRALEHWFPQRGE